MALFQLWGSDTQTLADEFVNSGLRAVTCCVDSHSLDKTFVGEQMDLVFFSSLPVEIDACSENGEFHSFVYDGPIFINL